MLLQSTNASAKTRIFFFKANPSDVFYITKKTTFAVIFVYVVCIYSANMGQKATF